MQGTKGATAVSLILYPIFRSSPDIDKLIAVSPSNMSLLIIANPILMNVILEALLYIVWLLKRLVMSPG